MFSHEEIVSLFNYTSTFKRESDYPLPTQYLPNLDYLLVSTMPFTRNCREIHNVNISVI